MEPQSPSSYNSHEYFIQPNFMHYEPTHYDVNMDSLPPYSPRLNFGNLNSLQLSGNGIPYYPSSYAPPRAQSPLQSISPPLTNASASDLSGNDNNGVQFSSSRSSGTESPASSHHEFVHRRPLRTNSSTTASAPISARTTRRAAAAPRRRSVQDDDFASDDDEPLPASTEVVATKRREEVRRQRIESEQRRRDELRDGYRRLKDVLPVSNQKSSKVSLLDRATTHIRTLEMSSSHMMMKISELEAETNRLRNINETLMLSTAERRSSGSSF